MNQYDTIRFSSFI